MLQVLCFQWGCKLTVTETYTWSPATRQFILYWIYTFEFDSHGYGGQKEHNVSNCTRNLKRLRVMSNGYAWTYEPFSMPINFTRKQSDQLWHGFKFTRYRSRLRIMVWFLA